MKISVKLPKSEMSAYKRAMNHALSQRPVTDSPNMNYLFPEAPNLLAALDSYVSTLDEYHPFRQARRDVIQYQRSHPDIEGFAQIMGVTEEWIDQLFLDAMRFENSL